MSGKSKSPEKALTATVIMIVITAALFLGAYIRITSIISDRCFGRMEEGVSTVLEEMSLRLGRDSRILNSIADILADADNFSTESMQETLSNFTPLMETKEVRVLMPDNTVIEPDGTLVDGNGNISFEEEAALGEHVSNRMSSMLYGDVPILRHFVPIIKDGETVALLYGVTNLEKLPQVMNIDHIYNGTASAYIIDTENGDLLMDTHHDSLGNIYDFGIEQIKNGAWDNIVKKIVHQKNDYAVVKFDDSEGWHYFYYKPSGINRWSIAVSVPQEEAFASLYQIRHVCLAIACLQAICVILYYSWSKKNVKAVVDREVEAAVLLEKLHKVEAAERAKTRFLSNMSHDIRTPMNAIIGFTTLAQTNIGNQKRVQEYLEKIMSSSNHLLSLINDILDMSRIESGHLNIEEKECGISDIFRDMRNIIQTQMQEKQLNFFMDTIDVVDEEIYCDKLHLNQILLNLLSNAVKFTPPGGNVSLTIRQKPAAPEGYGAYEIRVKDDGIGMSPEFAKHIFEPFEREKTSTVSGIQGTGLGMAITKSIVDTMGGTIQMETEQGKGTEFIINLQFRLQSEKQKIEVIRELKGLRALVVDDNFNTCDNVAKMLKQIGMSAVWTMHGKEAILRANQALEMGDEFHAYLIDWALPDMNGIEVARQIRLAVGEHVPIILLTAYDWSNVEDEARSAGVSAFCDKPVFFSELRDTLLATLNEGNLPKAETAILPNAPEQIRGKRLLLVEDNELNREIAEEILKESGFVVESAADGTIAVDMVKHSEPGYYALILMDIQMPIMNGYEATQNIRNLENPKLAKIPVIAMTANAFEEDKKKALDCGMDAHIAKPIDVNKLMEVLHQFLNQ